MLLTGEMKIFAPKNQDDHSSRKKELFTNGVWHVGIIENKRIRSYCLGDSEPEISPLYVTSLESASTRQKGKLNFYLNTLS